MVATKPILDIFRSRGVRDYQKDLDHISEEVRNAAQKIISAKKSTYYGIGMAMVRITRAILGDDHSVLTVSSMLHGEYGERDVYAGTIPDSEACTWLCGTFYHPAYDDFTVAERDGAVWLDYGNFHAPVRVTEDEEIIACEEDPVPDYMKLRRMEGGLFVETSDLAMWLPFRRVE